VECVRVCVTIGVTLTGRARCRIRGRVRVEMGGTNAPPFGLARFGVIWKLAQRHDIFGLQGALAADFDALRNVRSHLDASARGAIPAGPSGLLSVREYW
jgi:hypothetical protein